MKNFLIGAVILIVVCGIFGSCSSGSSSSDKYSGYSNTYKNDYQYRENVKDIAGAYGKTEKEVDAMINAITGGR